MLGRPLYLAGSDRGSGGKVETETETYRHKGGEFVIHLAHGLLTGTASLRPLLDLKGVFIEAHSFLPSALFFGHKPFETGNGMNFWTINRARKPVVCNAKLDAVEFFTHDVKLRYVRSESGNEGSNEEMFEYELKSVADWDKCHDDLDQYERSYSERDHETLASPVYAAIGSPGNGGTIHFPTCLSEFDRLKNQSIISMVNFLLSQNVSIISYRDIPHASEIICSFYIGIFVSDALQFSLAPSSIFEDAALDSYNAAAHHYNSGEMEFMPASWGAVSDSEKSPGVMQQTIRDLNNTKPLLMTLFLQSNRRDRIDRSLNAKDTRNKIMLSRIGAVGVFSKLLHTLSNDEIDLIDLIVMDRINERSGADWADD